MTRMLASVSSLDEANLVLAAGIDILDIKDPASGALGAVATDVVADIVKQAVGRCLTSATIGDLPMDTDIVSNAISKTADTGVDIVKVGLFTDRLSAECLEMFAEKTGHGTDIVLVCLADRQYRRPDFSLLRQAGLLGVMLDTADKSLGSIRALLPAHTLQQFINDAREMGLLAGLAGSLRQEDIAPLLVLKPDYLGFRGALCNRQQRTNSIDIEATNNIRKSIPITASSLAGSHPLPLAG